MCVFACQITKIRVKFTIFQSGNSRGGIKARKRVRFLLLDKRLKVKLFYHNKEKKRNQLCKGLFQWKLSLITINVFQAINLKHGPAR